MENTSTANRRIAKNTAFLYFRMLFLMVISLYTSRILLGALGYADYGINNIIGGFVVMFAFVNRSMQSVTQRFLTFELGKGNSERLQEVFRAALVIHVSIGLLVILFAETFGLWFLYNKLVIPTARFNSALWAYHAAVITTALSVSYVPFSSMIIAHERMNVFAWISILEGVLKIGTAFTLVFIKSDKLIAYAIITLLVQFIIISIYVLYCKRSFKEARLKLKAKRSTLKEITGFLGWNFYGTLGSVLTNQGINVLLNMFFGVLINAARGIAVQVEAAVLSFAENIQTAINPQITKNYAQGNLKNMHYLMFMNCKVTAVIMLVLSIPIVLETTTILKLWLKEYPDYSVSFLRLLLCYIMIEVLSRPFIIAVMATGHIKRFHCIIGSLQLFLFPACYVVMSITNNPNSAFVCMVAMSIIVLMFRVLLVKNMINLNLIEVAAVFIRIIVVSLVSFSIAYGLHNMFSGSIVRLIIVTLAGMMFTLVSMYFIGLSKHEQILVKNFALKKLKI